MNTKELNRLIELSRMSPRERTAMGPHAERLTTKQFNQMRQLSRMGIPREAVSFDMHVERED